MYYLIDDNNNAYEYYIKALEIYKKCPETEFIGKKIEDVEGRMGLLDIQDEEKSKDTRDLFLETLTKIGCQYEIGEGDDDRIYFAYQGEHFFVNAQNDWRYIQIWDTHWGHVELYDVDEFTRLRKAINGSNINNSVTTVYTIDEAGNNVDVHCKSIILFIPEIPDLENYL